jgi:Putative adhesin
MRHHLTVALALAIAASPLLAQQDSQDAQWLEHCRGHNHRHGRPEFCEVRVEHVALPSGPLEVDARENGAVDVVGGSGNELVVHELIEAEGSTDAEAQEIVSKIHVKTGSTIRADGPPEDGHYRHWTVGYRIEAPRKIDLKAESTNGPLSATNVIGHVDLRTENGPIELDGVGGSVNARTENGPLEVNLSGTRWDGTGLDAQTENGPVELTIPSNYGAHLETGTVNGPISIGFPITVEGRLNLKRLSLDIGGGGPTIRAVTTNGPVTVDRR